MLGPGYGDGDGYGRYQSLKYYGSTCTIINNNNVIGMRLMTIIIPYILSYATCPVACACLLSFGFAYYSACDGVCLSWNLTSAYSTLPLMLLDEDCVCCFAAGNNAPVNINNKCAPLQPSQSSKSHK